MSERARKLAAAVSIIAIPWWILAVIVLATWPRLPIAAGDVLRTTLEELSP
jgi:hypothetical protein